MKQPEKLDASVVLGVAAHPDDLDFAAGGTIAKLAEQGARVYYLILTDGSKGLSNTTGEFDKLIQQRQTEQQAAAAALQVEEVFFTNFEDGALENTADVRKEIVRYIRKLKPDTVITIDPSMLYTAKLGIINHPDHRAAGQATLDAVYPFACNAPSFPELLREGLEPHKVRTVLLANYSQPTCCVDITQTQGQKVTAINAHTSQETGIAAIKPALEQLTKEAGKEIGCKCGEGFVRIDLSD